ncbi:hypothetical protein ACF1BU_33905 [Streptomyces sp. NPDC014724]|uniref:hypothetical protein n=1 Tax=unclassified Streptomyces TaxID=2593676 RepID=UPI0037015794
MTRSPERPAVTTLLTTDLDEARALRHQLADQLAEAGHIRSPAVDEACMPCPGTPSPPKYRSRRRTPTTSSPPATATTAASSAPSLRPGCRPTCSKLPASGLATVSWSGSGGYNAALMAELVGPTGSVTTLDIDPAVTDRATRFLPKTGYDHVHVVTADRPPPCGAVKTCTPRVRGLRRPLRRSSEPLKDLRLLEGAELP